MYKVKSLTLPDHYTLMDVAYIFTWKRVSAFGQCAFHFVFVFGR